MMKTRSKLLLLIALLLLLMTAAPALTWGQCPKGKLNCDRPCREYVDQNGNSVCDRLESTGDIVGSVDSGTSASTEQFQPQDDQSTKAEENSGWSTDDSDLGQAPSAAAEVNDIDSTIKTDNESTENAYPETSAGEAVESSDTTSDIEQSSESEKEAGFLSTLLEPQFLVLLLLLILALVTVRQRLSNYVRLKQGKCRTALLPFVMILDNYDLL